MRRHAVIKSHLTRSARSYLEVAQANLTRCNKCAKRKKGNERLQMNLSTPQGFHDVLFDEAAARAEIQQNVQLSFANCGYKLIETPTLEQFDVMQRTSGMHNAPFKFFDSTGNLLAMRPDVTVQVARMCATRLSHVEEPLRFRYSHRVFREADGSLQAQARELKQIGAECVGPLGAAADAEVVGLLVQALEIAGVHNFTLALATVRPVRALLEDSGADAWWKACVLRALHTSDLVQLDRLTCENCIEEVAREQGISSDILNNFEFPEKHAQAIRSLARVRGGIEAIDAARKLVEPLRCSAGLDEFEELCEKVQGQLARSGAPHSPKQNSSSPELLIDFSMINNFDYYTGFVFSAFSPRVGCALGGGGRYDGLIGTFGADKPAAGCAFFLELVMEAAAKEAAAKEDGAKEAAPEASSAKEAAAKTSANNSAKTSANTSTNSQEPARPLRIAVPKGSLNASTISALSAAGLDTTGLENPGRQLIIKNPGVHFIIVRPTDAPAFVAHGAADCGICGRDSLLEANTDVVQLTDLNYGACRFVVAEPKGAAAATKEHYKRAGSIRVATKYPRITRAHYAKTGMQAEIVKLHGNIELAPLTGMAERIVDITATGTTLRENNLCVVEEVLHSTARFFANVSAYRTDERCAKLAAKLAEKVSE